MKIKLLTLIFIINILAFNNSWAMLLDDTQAYAYCLANPKSYVAIIWPKAQGKDDELQELFKKYGVVHYKKISYLNKEQAIEILTLAHPKVTNMVSHLKEYFPKDSMINAVRVYLVDFDSLPIALECKHAIRDFFGIGHISIHINDHHPQGIELAQFFFVRHVGIK